MKHSHFPKKFLAGFIAVIPLWGFNTDIQNNFGWKPYGISYIESLPKQKLTEKEIKELLYMREEEKLARDVYLTLYRRWGLPIFRNIARSEQMHMNILGALIKKYGLQDSVIDRIGVFRNQHLQLLYNKLVAKGEKSLTDALEVGALIEELDITDLKKAIENTDNEDLKVAYANLTKGSRNHLRAFVRVLKRLGYQYSPKYLPKEEFEKIVSTPMERGFIRNPN